MRQTEHRQKSLKEKSTVAKHAWQLDDAFKWKESKTNSSSQQLFRQKVEGINGNLQTPNNSKAKQIPP